MYSIRIQYSSQNPGQVNSERIYSAVRTADSFVNKHIFLFKFHETFLYRSLKFGLAWQNPNPENV